jgi:hypothetical protein
MQKMKLKAHPDVYDDGAMSYKSSGLFNSLIVFDFTVCV